MTILLGLLNYIKTNKIIPKNNIVFIFQPAEEAPGGAQPMIENNLMTDYNINEIFRTSYIS
jgi:Metal-dependent amidase/aminoacylase/carboxypeptidase